MVNLLAWIVVAGHPGRFSQAENRQRFCYLSAESSHQINRLIGLDQSLVCASDSEPLRDYAWRPDRQDSIAGKIYRTQSPDLSSRPETKKKE